MREPTPLDDDLVAAIRERCPLGSGDASDAFVDLVQSLVDDELLDVPAVIPVEPEPLAPDAYARSSLGRFRDAVPAPEDAAVPPGGEG